MSRPVTFARPVLDLTRTDAPQTHNRPGSSVSLRALLSTEILLKPGQDGLAHWIASGQDVLPIFGPMCAALAAQDWQIDFYDGGEHAVIDAIHHTLYLPHFGYACRNWCSTACLASWPGSNYIVACDWHGRPCRGYCPGIWGWPRNPG